MDTKRYINIRLKLIESQKISITREMVEVKLADFEKNVDLNGFIL